jgi:prepilin-type N-terminal cleavage/methylation domain-containing protein
MSPAVARAVARRRARTGGQVSAEAGFSLIELLVTVIIVGIVLSMTVVIVSTFILQAANTQRVGLASETAQSAMAQIDQYLRGAVSPANVQSAAADAGSPTSACWGAQPPGPAGGIVLSQNQAQSLAIISAHDFDLWFCGYKNGDAQPHVWQITMNTGPGMCANSDPQGGYCTLQLIDHGTACVPGAGPALAGSDVATCLGAGNTPTGNAVLSIPNVWCDQFCQGTPAGDPVTETYSSGQSGPQYQSYAVACINQPTSLQVPPGCVGASPPLFEYYLGAVSVSGAQGGRYYCSGTSGGACDPSPMNPTCPSNACSASATYTLPSSVCTLNCQSPLDLSVSALPLGPGAPPAVNILAGIELVVVDFTVGAPASANQTIDNGSPGASLSNQVFLVNQINRGYQACGYDNALSGLANADANWQMTDTGGTVGNASVVDSSALGASDGSPDTGTILGNVGMTGGVMEGQTPGPLACNTSSPAMSFPGTANNYITTRESFCASSTLVGGTCPTVPTGPQSFSIIVWFKTSAVSQGILGFVNQSGTESDRLLSVNASGDLAWEVCDDCTTSASDISTAQSSVTVNTGTWHMAVATVGPVTNASALTPGGGGQYLYLDGVLAGSNNAEYAWNFAGSWQIGQDPSNTLNPFNGEIGRVAIIPQVLTPEQVTQLYDDSGTTTSCAAGAAVGAQPIAYYPTGTDDVTSFAGNVATVHDHAPWQFGTKTQAYNATEIHPVAPISGDGPAVPNSTQGGPPFQCDSLLTALPLNLSGPDVTYVDLGRPPGGASGGQPSGGLTGGVLGPNWPAANTDPQLTVEAWVDVNSYLGGQNIRLLSDDRSHCTDRGFELTINDGGGSGYFSVGNGTAPGGCDGADQDTAASGYTDNAHDGNAYWIANSGGCLPSTSSSGTIVDIPDICASTAGGSWYFVVGTYDGTTVRVYVDGTEVASVPYSGDIAPPTTVVGSAGDSTCGAVSDVDIGFNPENCDGYLDGFVTGAAVYQTALSGQQIQDQYVAGTEP